MLVYTGELRRRLMNNKTLESVALINLGSSPIQHEGEGLPLFLADDTIEFTVLKSKPSVLSFDRS